MPTAAFRCLLLLLPLLLIVEAARARAADRFVFGGFAVQRVLDGPPGDVEVTADGRILVSDPLAGVVRVLDRSLEPVGTIGRRGSGPGELLDPSGLAIDGGTLLVADTGNDRIQRFDLASGAVLGAWGAAGDEPGRLRGPSDVAVVGDSILVIDAGNARVQVFAAGGDFEGLVDPAPPDGAAGGAVTWSAGWRSPVRIAAAGDGRRACVVDADANRLTRLEIDPDAGRPVATGAWGDWGPFLGLMDEPLDVAWHADRIYVVDSRNHRIQAFDERGELVYQWGIHALRPREGEGKLHDPSAVAIAPDGSFAVVAEAFEQRLQVFGRAAPGVTERDAATPMTPRPPETHFGRHLALDGTLLAIGEPETHTVHLFRCDREIPVRVSELGMRGPSFGQFIRPAGLVLEADDPRLLVADPARGVIQAFALDLDPLAPPRFQPQVSRMTEGVIVADRPSFAELGPLRLDQLRRGWDGGVLAIDRRGHRVLDVGADWTVRGAFGGAGEGSSHLRDPLDVVVVDESTVAVVDAGNRRVVMFARDGSVLGTIGEVAGDFPGFRRPSGIAIDEDRGLIHVADAGAHGIFTFDLDGAFVRRFGEQGYRDGQLWKPGDLAVDAGGRIFVADDGNHRAQIFDAEGRWLVAFGLGRPSTPARPKRYD